MAEGNNFIIDIITTLKDTKSKVQLNADIKRIQKELNKLELKAEVSPDSIADIQKKLSSIKIKAEFVPESVQNLAKQLEDIANRHSISISNININSGQAEKTGRQIGQGINSGLTASLNDTRQQIDHVLKEISGQKLNSYDLSKMFNLNRKDISSSVIKQVQELTRELNSLAKEAVKTGSDSSWDGIINKVSILSNVLSQFGKSRDLSSFKESVDILNYFQNKKIFIDDKSETIQNTGMSVRQLNNEYRNLGITFTTVAKDSTRLDTVWTELSNISPDMEKLTTFGDQISAVINHFKTAKEAIYGDSNLQPLNGKAVTDVLFDWMDKLTEASSKINILREQEAEIQQQISEQAVTAANTVVENEGKKRQAYGQTAEKLNSLYNSNRNPSAWTGGKIVDTDYSQQVEQQIEKYNRLGLELPNVKARIDELKAAEQQLNSVLNSENSTLEQQTEAYQRFQAALRSAKASNSIAGSMYMSQNAVNELIVKLQNLSQSNTNMTETAKAEINGWIMKLQQTGAVYKSMGNDAVAAMKRIQNEQAKTGKSGGSMFASLKKGLSSFSYLASPLFMLMQLVSKVRQAFTELKEINSIMTEISKVSEMTSKELKKLEEEAYGTASKYGRTVSDYLTGIQEMSRAGFQGDKAEEMAELSVLAQAAGDMSAELSNEYLISTNAAYKLNGEADKLNEILDGQNYISNKNAASMEHMANATKVAASQAASAGVTVDEMSAAIGTMVAVTQDSGEVAGRAFKAILMNLQQVSGELDDGEIINEESLTKYEEACKNLGVSLKTVKDGVVSLRDPMQILKELSEAYTSLDQDDARRANLISAIGGKHRGNQLNALLENWGTYEKMLAEYSQGSGSAMEEAMKSANNWEGSLNRLQNTWVNTVENIANSDAVITIINGTNTLLEVLNKLTAKLGSIGTIGTGAFIFLNKGRSNTILPCRVVTPYSKF